jgi:hypothetical protein
MADGLVAGIGSTTAIRTSAGDAGLFAGLPTHRNTRSSPPPGRATVSPQPQIVSTYSPSAPHEHRKPLAPWSTRPKQRRQAWAVRRQFSAMRRPWPADQQRRPCRLCKNKQRLRCARHTRHQHHAGHSGGDHGSGTIVLVIRDLWARAFGVPANPCLPAPVVTTRAMLGADQARAHPAAANADGAQPNAPRWFDRGWLASVRRADRTRHARLRVSVWASST